MFGDWKDTFKCKRISGARVSGGGGGVVGLLVVMGRGFGRGPGPRPGLCDPRVELGIVWSRGVAT